MANDSTTRFSNRVDDYVKYRPAYPSSIVDFLQDKYGITPDAIVADIGSGTGISSRLFLEKEYTVIGVEPNKEMRERSVELLKEYKKFTTIAGTAEQTLLKDKTADLVIAGQAYHWFNAVDAKAEFRRIIKPGGIVALVWNERLITSSFEKDYDELIINYAKNYKMLNHRNIDFESIKKFFHPHHCELTEFPNHQDFDFDGLKGRLLSSSYMPLAGEEGYEEMLISLDILYKKYQGNNIIRIGYDTRLYSGYF